MGDRDGPCGARWDETEEVDGIGDIIVPVEADIGALSRSGLGVDGECEVV